VWRIRQRRGMERDGIVAADDPIRRSPAASVRARWCARRSLAGGAFGSGTCGRVSPDGRIGPDLLRPRCGPVAESGRGPAGCGSVCRRWRDLGSLADSMAWRCAHRTRHHRDTARVVRSRWRETGSVYALWIGNRPIESARDRRHARGDGARTWHSRAVRPRRVEHDRPQDGVVIKLTLRGTVWPSPTSTGRANAVNRMRRDMGFPFTPAVVEPERLRGRCERLLCIGRQRRLRASARPVSVGACDSVALRPRRRPAAGLRNAGVASILSGAKGNEPATNLISRRFIGASSPCF